MKNILADITPDQVRLDPFPHLVVENVLPKELADRLLREMPALETITQGRPYVSNQRFSYNAADSLTQQHLSPLWQEFVAAHVASEFYQDVVRLFGSAISRAWPHLAARLNAPSAKVGLRNREHMEDVDVVL